MAFLDFVHSVRYLNGLTLDVISIKNTGEGLINDRPADNFIRLTVFQLRYFVTFG